ncbi:hypothetical protein BS17DRAFT_773965 [Gyrodon lividus]|nr:hypothetical protein BS17DRAFT_773965 [Gyrodon lividus]
MSFVNRFFVGQRRAQAIDPTSISFLPANPSYIPAGPEAAPPTLTSQSVPSTLAPQSGSSSGGLSTASTAYITILSLFGLVAVAYAIWKIRRWQRKSKGLPFDERPSEKAEILDVEAAASACPIIPVASQPGVRWTPQIRSISSSLPAEGPGKKSAALSPKRARSPPPTYLTKPQNPFVDPYPKSAPAHTLSFADNELRTLGRGSEWEASPPVTPHALAVSGMQTRSLGRPGQVSKF